MNNILTVKILMRSMSLLRTYWHFLWCRGKPLRRLSATASGYTQLFINGPGNISTRMIDEPMRVKLFH